MPDRRAYIGIGTNIEPRLQRMERAIEALASVGRVERVSAIIDTEPVGYTAQPNFLNAVAQLTTELEPRELLRRLRAIEIELGREVREKWHEREIDFDILLFGNEVIHQADLTIPHPEMHRRLFVLEPLAEIAADAVHPESGKSIRELLAELRSAGDV